MASMLLIASQIYSQTIINYLFKDYFTYDNDSHYHIIHQIFIKSKHFFKCLFSTILQGVVAVAADHGPRASGPLVPNFDLDFRHLHHLPSDTPPRGEKVAPAVAVSVFADS